MKNIILVISLALSAVAVSLSYSIKDENNMSELVEANIEALSKESLNRYPCIKTSIPIAQNGLLYLMEQQGLSTILATGTIWKWK